MLVCSPANAPCQPQADTQPPPLTLSGSISLRRLTDLVSEHLGVAIDYDPAALQGEITARDATGLDDRELWELLNATLVSRGLTTVRAAARQGYSIIKLSDAAGASSVSRESIAASRDPSFVMREEETMAPEELLVSLSDESCEPGYQALIAKVQNRPVAELAEAIGKVLSKPAGAATALGTGHLLLSDLTPRLQLALTLLARLDGPGEEPSESAGDALRRLSGRVRYSPGRRRSPRLGPGSFGGAF